MHYDLYNKSVVYGKIEVPETYQSLSAADHSLCAAGVSDAKSTEVQL